MPKKPIKVHLVSIRKNAWGGFNTGSYCGRLRTVTDGMNLTETRSKVTCDFCLKKLKEATRDKKRNQD